MSFFFFFCKVTTTTQVKSAGFSLLPSSENSIVCDASELWAMTWRNAVAIVCPNDDRGGGTVGTGIGRPGGRRKRRQRERTTNGVFCPNPTTVTLNSNIWKDLFVHKIHKIPAFSKYTVVWTEQNEIMENLKRLHFLFTFTINVYVL